jgi:hypothetical protein
MSLLKLTEFFLLRPESKGTDYQFTFFKRYWTWLMSVLY